MFVHSIGEPPAGAADGAVETPLHHSMAGEPPLLHRLHQRAASTAVLAQVVQWLPDSITFLFMVTWWIGHLSHIAGIALVATHTDKKVFTGRDPGT